MKEVDNLLAFLFINDWSLALNKKVIIEYVEKVN